MKFNSLFKLYAMDIEQFKKTFISRFNSESTIKLFVEINGNQAFFFYHNEINRLVYKIREMDKRVNKLFEKLPSVAKNQYIKKCLIDEVCHTNAIEGIISTRKEIRELIEDINLNIDSKKRFKGIVNRYFKMTNNEEIRLEKPQDIRDLYDEILLEEIKNDDINNVPDGIMFRKDNVNVTTSSGKIIHTGIMPESKIVEYIDETLIIINDESMEPVIRIAIAHYLFSYIHPFYDGNGRINRFISSYILSKYCTPIIAYRLSATIKENLSTYYDAFKITNDIRNRADITTFVYEFLKIIYLAYEKTETYALSKLNEVNLYVEKTQELSYCKALKDLLNILIQAEIFSENGVTINEISTQLDLSISTCRNNLNKLIEEDLVIQRYFGKKKVYSADLDRINKKCNNFMSDSDVFFNNII